ncbi:MAG TPA: response regulator [Thermoanaerobaculia bacterium]|nr:response regulator [Thermoanaerobaculia bacterium]
MDRILVVDDDTDQLMLEETVLARAGFAVSTLSDPLRAPELARRGEFGAVVLDVMMPGLDGYELLDLLRADERTRSVPILLLSSLADAVERVRGLQHGADDYLGKPFHPKELVFRLQRLLAKAAGQAESLEGKLEDFSFSEVVQVLERNRKSGFLAVIGKEGFGRLVLREGAIFGACFARLTGADALVALMTMGWGRFRFTSHPAPQQVSFLAEQPIDLQWAILEAAWIEDELARRWHCLPQEDAPLVPSGPAELGVPEAFPRLPVAPVLDRIRTLPDVTLADLLTGQWAAPSRIRLTVAWLIENGAVRIAGESGAMERVQ